MRAWIRWLLTGLGTILGGRLSDTERQDLIQGLEATFGSGKTAKQNKIEDDD